MISKHAYLLKTAGDSLPKGSKILKDVVPGGNTFTSKSALEPSVKPNKLLAHLGKHWPGYGAAALAGYAGMKYLNGKKHKVEAQNAGA